MQKSIQKFWDKLPAWVKNKYVITSIAFLTYLMFFDSNDIPSQIQNSRHLAKLNKQAAYCEKMIEEDQKEYEATFSSLEQMETYAREHYLMKKPEETLYVIEVK